MLLDAKNVSKAFGEFLGGVGRRPDRGRGRDHRPDRPERRRQSRPFSIAWPATCRRPSGRIVLQRRGRSPAPRRKRHARAGIGRTFQVPATFDDMTVIDNVMVGAFLRHPHRNDARDHARRIVDLMGLQPDQPARSLGTPGRKRLEIARVLATSPRLMLLDESLAGLTPTELHDAIALVRRIHEMGVTIVIVEHIMEVIMTLDQACAWCSIKAMSSPAARPNRWSRKRR